jgi:hypothetical protein
MCTATATFAAGGTSSVVRGTVFGASGKPVAGAAIMLRARDLVGFGVLASSVAACMICDPSVRQ